MGFLKGNISFCSYKMIGQKDKWDFNAINKQIKKYAIPTIDSQVRNKEMVYGWDVPHLINLYDEERYGEHWDLSDCRIGNDYLLRLRIETRKVPQEYFKLRWNQQEQEYLQEDAKDQGEDKKRISKRVLKEEREFLKEELLQKALPSIKYIEILVKSSGKVYLCSTSKKIQELFEELFTKTFVQPLKARLVKNDPLLESYEQGLITGESWHPEMITSMEKLLPTMMY